MRCIKSGSDLCILGYGPILSLAWEAARHYEAKQGGSVAIYSAHTVKPLDTVGIGRLLNQFRRVVVLEEHSSVHSLGGQVKQLAWDARSGSTIGTLSLQDEFIHLYGSRDDLLRAHGITLESLLACMSDNP